MRTQIKLVGDSKVRLSAIDPLTGEVSIRYFVISARGGYVCDRKNMQQVCNNLFYEGCTLTAESGEDLLKVIRREWRAYRRWVGSLQCKR